MKTLLGYNQFDLRNNHHNPVHWEPKRLVNSHVMLLGDSGTGKSFQLKKLLASIVNESAQEKPPRIHLFDPADDLATPDSFTSDILFSETTPYGINPLEINPDPNFGGVRRATESFIGSINRIWSKLGPRQEGALRRMITDIYLQHDINKDKPETWGNALKLPPEERPCVSKLIEHANAKLREMYLGSGGQCAAAIEEVNKFTRRMHSAALEYQKLERQNAHEELLKKADKLLELKQNALNAMREYLMTMETGLELDDVLAYENEETIKSLIQRLENMHGAGIFSSTPPPFDPSKEIWRYRIQPLSTRERRMFVEFRLERIFARAQQRGHAEHGEIRDCVVLDEAAQYVFDDPDHILNVMARESRKFGIQLILASQQIEHFSQDLLGSMGAKIILGLDQIQAGHAVRKLGIEEKQLKHIQPRHSMIYLPKHIGETATRPIPIALSGHH